MPIQGASFSEPVVFAPGTSSKKYAYRTGMGMVPSAEFAVFFDDFLGFNAATSFAPAGWTTILTSGGTVKPVVTAGLGSTGVISLFDTTLLEGVAIHQATEAAIGPVQLTVGKRAYFEFRVRVSDVTDHNLFMGLSKATAITVPEDLYDDSADDLLAIGILDASAGAITIRTDTANAGITATATTGTMVVDTWTVLALEWDGVSRAYAWKDGEIIGSTTTTIPTGVTLTPFVSAVQGDTGTATSFVDYVRYAIER